jgi:fructokinase
MDMDTYLLLGLGEVLWDLLPAGKRLGGAPANFAIHAGSLGAEGVIASAIGMDGLGRALLDHVALLSLHCDYIFVDPGHPTGSVRVTVTNDGKPSYSIEADVAWDFIPEREPLTQLAAQVDAVCFGTLAQRSGMSRRTIQAFLAVLPIETLCIFDVNLRPPFYSIKIVESSMPLTNVLKLSDEELPMLAGLLSVSPDEDAFIDEMLRRYSLKLIALTKGKAGSVLYTPGRVSIHPGFQVQVVDSVGAGDAFTAALAMGMLRGDELDRINEDANRVASYVCTQPGATPPLPAHLRALYCA